MPFLSMCKELRSLARRWKAANMHLSSSCICKASSRVDQPESVVTWINVGLTSGRQACPIAVSATKPNGDHPSLCSYASKIHEETFIPRYCTTYTVPTSSVSISDIRNGSVNREAGIARGGFAWTTRKARIHDQPAIPPL